MATAFLVTATMLIALSSATSAPARAAAGPISGYVQVAADGQAFSFGNSPAGPQAGRQLNQPVVGVAPDSVTGGFWEVASDGGIFTYGGAPFLGSTGSIRLNKPIVGMAATPEGSGYWLVASDGGIFSFGTATFFGSMGGHPLNQPIVGMASTADGDGYWLVAADGGIFSFGDASFFGSTGNIALNKPIVGMARTVDGDGYWLAASDGGIFAFGRASFLGSMGNTHLNAPITGMAVDSDTNGYWLVAADGGVFTFGAPYLGSSGGQTHTAPVVAMAATTPPPPPCPTPVTGAIPAPTGGDPYWIITNSALSALEQSGLSPALVDFFFNNRNTFVVGGACGSGLNLPNATPVVSVTSLSTLSQPNFFSTVPFQSDGVLYDDEAWTFTPQGEQQHPIQSASTATTVAHGQGRFLIFTPATNLETSGPTQNQDDNYLDNNIAGQGAAVSDIFEIQSQGLELAPRFASFVSTAASQANKANPQALVLAGLSTDGGGNTVTASELFADFQSIQSTVNGIWLNIPGTSAFCPNCGSPQPQAAVGFLQMLAASLGVSP